MKRSWAVRTAIGLCLLGAVILAGLAAWMLLQQPNSAQTTGGGLTTTASVGGPFELVTHDGRTVTDADFHGRYMLVYFGYTYCPDICPTELGTMAAAIDQLGAEGEQVTPVFVTIDPERDTPDALADYVAAFHQRMIGLTGTPEQIAQAAKGYKVFYRKAPASGDGEDYLMEHTSFIYLMGPDGESRAIFGQGATPAELAAAIHRIIAG